MELRIRQMAREGWRILSVRSDTQLVLASYFGAASVLRWDPVDEELKAIGPGEAAIYMKTEASS